MSMPTLLRRVRCLVPGCGKRLCPNRSGNYPGHKWGTTTQPCPGASQPALELRDQVTFNVGDHPVTGTITWLGWDATGPTPGALAAIDVEGTALHRRTALLRRVGR
jgi:hypothetical protein